MLPVLTKWPVYWCCGFRKSFCYIKRYSWDTNFCFNVSLNYHRSTISICQYLCVNRVRNSDWKITNDKLPCDCGISITQPQVCAAGDRVEPVALSNSWSIVFTTQTKIAGRTMRSDPVQNRRNRQSMALSKPLMNFFRCSHAILPSWSRYAGSWSNLNTFHGLGTRS